MQRKTVAIEQRTMRWLAALGTYEMVTGCLIRRLSSFS